MKKYIKIKLLHMLMGKEAMAKQPAIHAYWAQRAPLTTTELCALQLANLTK